MKRNSILFICFLLYIFNVVHSVDFNDLSGSIAKGLFNDDDSKRFDIDDFNGTIISGHIKNNILFVIFEGTVTRFEELAGNITGTLSDTLTDASFKKTNGIITQVITTGQLNGDVLFLNGSESFIDIAKVLKGSIILKPKTTSTSSTSTSTISSTSAGESTSESSTSAGESTSESSTSGGVSTSESSTSAGVSTKDASTTAGVSTKDASTTAGVPTTGSSTTGGVSTSDPSTTTSVPSTTNSTSNSTTTTPETSKEVGEDDENPYPTSAGYISAMTVVYVVGAVCLAFIGYLFFKRMRAVKPVENINQRSGDYEMLSQMRD